MREVLRTRMDSAAIGRESGDASSVTRGRWGGLGAAHATTAYVTGGLAAVVVIAAGTAMNLWFLPFIAGLAAGLTARHGRLRILLPVTAVIAMAGWVVPLAWQAAHGQPIGATALVVAALAGLPASAALIVGLTLLVAAVQAITGLWLARASTGRRPSHQRHEPT
jgi:hypothetical protein